MKWLDVAYLFVFLSNFVFMVAAGHLLVKVMSAIHQSKLYLAEAVGATSEASMELKSLSKHLTKVLKVIGDESDFHETKTGKAITALSLDVRNLSNKFQAGTADAPATSAGADRGANEDLTQRFRDKLKDVMSQNIQLKNAIERTKHQLNTAISTNDGNRTSLSEAIRRDGSSAALVIDLTRKTDELRSDLEEARRRAQTAEKLAEANAMKLEDLRQEASVKSFGDRVGESAAMEKLRAQNDAMSVREQSLLARIEAMEMEFARNLTEKNFIEERYVSLDLAKQDERTDLEIPVAAN